MTYIKATTVSDGITEIHVSSWRLHVMRVLFFLNFIGLAYENWSEILFPTSQMDTLTGVTIAFWAAFSLLNLLGARFPLQFLPILMLQFLYKGAWIIGTYLPAWKAGVVDEYLQSFFWVCVAGVTFNLLIIPWNYVYHCYLKNFFNFRQNTTQ